ncbi:hypothetical protein [Rhizorhabdus dicambivorans]|uniref:hypothetical protein n=1 Tax=Rhizorhabdus dicambivorans TaxID=1850238 RepID=UPI001111F0A1|nr:hypothetical protein [Rhizorhabdus dicambivorans]
MFDQSASPLRRLEAYLGIYVQYFSPKHRTDTKELIYYLGSPLQGRRIIYFGLSFKGDACGFAVLMYYPDEKIGIFDFIVIAPNRRGYGAYFAFADLIAEYLEEKRIIANYFVSEVLVDYASSAHAMGPHMLVRLLRFQGFKRARIDYMAPDPSCVKSVSSCRALLMIAPSPDREQIDAGEFMKIVDLIYFNHYLRWYGPFLSDGRKVEYARVLTEERERLHQRAHANDPITLNGMKDADVRLEPATERHRAGLAVVLMTSALVSIPLAVAPSVQTGIVVLSLAAVIFVAVLSNRTVRRQFLRIFDQLG